MNSSELVSLDAVWLGYCEYSSSCFHCYNEFIRNASLITPLIYPCHSAGGTVRAFTLASYLPPRLIMPSADSRIRDGLASRLAHSADSFATASTYSCSSPYGVRLIGVRDALPTDAGIFFTGFPNIPVAYSDGLIRDAAGLPG